MACQVHRATFASLLALAAVACRTPAPSEAPGATVSTTAPTRAEGRTYRVVSEASLLQVFAYRGGALARAGHNHVIASRHLQGELRLGDDATRAQFELTIPVSLLTIDEPELRAAAGADFATDVTDSAKDGTRKNMLSEALLDGERFPGIRLRMSAVELASTGYIASVETLVKDVPRVHRVPLTLERGAAEVVATGEFELKQSDLGLKPFSVMMGALAVQDAMRVRFRVVARAS